MFNALNVRSRRIHIWMFNALNVKCWIEWMFNVQCSMSIYLYIIFLRLLGLKKCVDTHTHTHTHTHPDNGHDIHSRLTGPHDPIDRVVLIRRALCVFVLVSCTWLLSAVLLSVHGRSRPRLPSSSSALVLVCSHLPVRPRLLLACCCPPSCVALGDCRLLCFRLLCYGLLCFRLLCFRLLCSWPSCSARGLLVDVACQWLRAAVNLLYYYQK